MRKFMGALAGVGLVCAAGICLAARFEQLRVNELTATTLTVPTATIAGVASGVQTESVTNTETLTVSSKLVNVTGGTGASLVVTLASPTSTQLGEFVRLRNVGTNALNVVYKSITTNAIAVGKQTLWQAIDAGATGWEPVYTTP